MATSSQRQIFAEINITPLTDIFLVLLIIMMVVAPMMRQLRGDIKPPEVTAGAPADQDKLTVEVLANGDVFVDGEPTAIPDLTEALKVRREAMVAEDAETTPADPEGLSLAGEAPNEGIVPKGVVVVRADKTARTESVLKVFDAARDAGYAKLTIAGAAPTSKPVSSSPAPLSPLTPTGKPMEGM